MSKTNPQSGPKRPVNLTSAAETLRERCERMLAVAEDSEGHLSGCFSESEIRSTVRDCMNLVTAIADCPDIESLKSASRPLGTLRDRALAIDAILLERTVDNPRIMSAIISCESTLLSLLEQSDPTVQILANLGLKFRREAETLLTGMLTDLRKQLERSECEPVHHRGLAARLRESLSSVIYKCVQQAIREPLLKSEIAHRNALNNSARRLLKAYSTPLSNNVTIEGPRTEACRRQIMSVVTYLADPKNPQGLRGACHKTFSPLKDGYANANCMYTWCNRNETRVRRWVEAARLSSD